MSRCAHLPTRGMTLVEVLLVVTLFSMIVVAVAGLVTLGMRAQQGQGKGAQPYRQMERALRRLEDDVEAAQPFFGAPTLGDTSQFAMARIGVRSNAGEASQGGWVQVRYRLESQADGTWLIREEIPWGLPRDGGMPSRSEPLMRVVSGHFTFGAMDPNGQLTWVSSWDGQTAGMPRLVTFACELPVDDGQPPLALSRVIRNPAGALPRVEEGLP